MVSRDGIRPYTFPPTVLSELVIVSAEGILDADNILVLVPAVTVMVS